jgi:hypothetical protein
MLRLLRLLKIFEQAKRPKYLPVNTDGLINGTRPFWIAPISWAIRKTRLTEMIQNMVEAERGKMERTKEGEK